MSFYGYTPIQSDYSYIARAGEGIGKAAGAVAGQIITNRKEKKQWEKYDEEMKGLRAAATDAIAPYVGGTSEAARIAERHYWDRMGGESYGDAMKRLASGKEKFQALLETKKETVRHNAGYDKMLGGYYTEGNPAGLTVSGGTVPEPGEEVPVGRGYGEQNPGMSGLSLSTQGDQPGLVAGSRVTPSSQRLGAPTVSTTPAKERELRPLSERYGILSQYKATGKINADQYSVAKDWLDKEYDGLKAAEKAKVDKEIEQMKIDAAENKGTAKNANDKQIADDRNKTAIKAAQIRAAASRVGKDNDKQIADNRDRTAIEVARIYAQSRGSEKKDNTPADPIDAAIEKFIKDMGEETTTTTNVDKTSTRNQKSSSTTTTQMKKGGGSKAEAVRIARLAKVIADEVAKGNRVAEQYKQLLDEYGIKYQ